MAFFRPNGRQSGLRWNTSTRVMRKVGAGKMGTTGSMAPLRRAHHPETETPLESVRRRFNAADHTDRVAQGTLKVPGKTRVILRTYSATSEANHRVKRKLPQQKQMLDTIRVKASIPVLSDREQELRRNESTAWTNRSEQVFHSHTKQWIEEINAHHRDSGFNATVNEGTLTKARASLPRLIHGSNGILIKTPDELLKARSAFLTCLSFLNNKAREDNFKITGLDLVLNFPLDPQELLALHRNAKHPMIHRETEEYYNAPVKKTWGKPPHVLNSLNTVRFHGTRTTIQLYDKVREVLKCKAHDWPEKSPCTRVEIQLRGAKHIAKQLRIQGRDFVTLDQLDFRTCYLAYRRILMGFDENGAVPTFKPDTVSFLAILEKHPETWESIGMRPLDWYRSTVAKRTFRETRRQVGKLQLELGQFRWADQLPMDHLPSIVDIDQDGREQLVHHPWNFRCPTDGVPGVPSVD